MLHIHCSNVNSYSSAPESNRPNPQDKTMHFPFFFRYKHINSLKSLPLLTPSESLPYWFQGNFGATFVLNFCLREFLLSAFANRFESRCEPKRLMLLQYKICPCFWAGAWAIIHRICSLEIKVHYIDITAFFFFSLRFMPNQY